MPQETMKQLFMESQLHPGNITPGLASVPLLLPLRCFLLSILGVNFHLAMHVFNIYTTYLFYQVRFPYPNI